jgi:hypothetical protein
VHPYIQFLMRAMSQRSSFDAVFCIGFRLEENAVPDSAILPPEAQCLFCTGTIFALRHSARLCAQLLMPTGGQNQGGEESTEQ